MTIAQEVALRSQAHKYLKFRDKIIEAANDGADGVTLHVLNEEAANYTALFQELGFKVTSRKIFENIPSLSRTNLYVVWGSAPKSPQRQESI